MDHNQLFQHQVRNTLQSILLVITLGGLCAWLAWFIGGLPLAVLTACFILLAYRLNPVASPEMIIRLFRGRALSPSQAPELYHLLYGLSEKAGLHKVPMLFYLPSNVMNAFTTGSPDNAAIGLSDGVLRRLNMRELAGVLGHELVHIVNQDTRMMAFADLTSRITSLFSLGGQLLLIINLPLLLFSGASLPWAPIMLLLASPILSALVQLALSRNREYDADLGSAKLTGDPLAPASALRKMEYPHYSLFSQIILPGPRIPDPSLLRTHPPSDERIKRLVELAESLPITEQAINTHPKLNHLVSVRPLRTGWHRNGMWY
ncbi:MAG: zinc metalloprotease HtpX [Gammaproteobacteria bacterium]|nr:zinc metalloprotease HtpX [Gammaproteobacteria bacterium]